MTFPESNGWSNNEAETLTHVLGVLSQITIAPYSMHFTIGLFITLPANLFPMSFLVSSCLKFGIS